MVNVQNKILIKIMILTMLSVCMFSPNHTLANQGDIGKEIALSATNNIVLKDVHLIPVESGQIAFVTIDVNNNSENAFDFYPYWIRVQSSVGERFKVHLMDDQKSTKVYPRSTRSFSYFAEIPHQLTMADLNIQLIKWDFSSVNYESLVHTFSIPDQIDLGVVEIGEKGVIEVQGVPISLEVTDVREIEGALRKSGNFTLTLTNVGNRSVKLPIYDYELQGNGYSFPAQIKSSDEEITLLPNVEKKIGLTVQMSLESEMKDYHLVVSEQKKDIEPLFSVPLTSFAFEVPEGHVGGVPVGETTSIMYGLFDFDVRLENLHLVPSTDFEDILSYDVYITNKNESRVALPELASFVHVKDELSEKATQKEEEKKELFPDEEIKLTMFASIPEKANTNELSITFESSIDANPNEEMGGLEEVFATYMISSGNIKREGTVVTEAHHFSDLGDKSTIEPYQATTYDTNSSKILVSQFVVENKDNKPIRVPEYKGYYKSTNGDIFPVLYKGRAEEIINPNSSAIVTYWAEISRGLELKDVQLTLGIPINEDSEALSEVATFQVIGHSPVERSTAYPLQYYISSMRVTSSVREELSRIHYRDDPDGLEYMKEIGSISVEYTLRKDYQDNVLDDGYERTLSFELRNSGGTLLDRREDVNLGDLNSGKNVISLDANVRLHEVFSLRVRVYENFENGRKSIGTYSIGW